MQVLQAAYSIVVPVRNEATMLPTTVPKLLEATAGDSARIVWVCNGCSDGSAAVIRSLAGPEAEVIELSRPSKTSALQAGDDTLGQMFPRLYLDADTWLSPGDPARLMNPLWSGTADLVAPGLRFETAGASFLSARIGACWLSLPHARTAAFSNAIGLSSAARGLWNKWPEITGDDIFASALIPIGRKRIVSEVLATISMPRSFVGWVRMRARWMRGEAELRRLGLEPPEAPKQRAELLRRMIRRDTALGAWAFVAARMLARLPLGKRYSSAWMPDRAMDRGSM